MILPDLLRDWSDHHSGTPKKAVMIVFPAQYGAQNINNSMITFRNKHPQEIRLVTGVEKDDQLYFGDTRFQIATYGMVWQWLAKSGQEGV